MDLAPRGTRDMRVAGYRACDTAQGGGMVRHRCRHTQADLPASAGAVPGIGWVL
jgi:hypothetical protein